MEILTHILPSLAIVTRLRKLVYPTAKAVQQENTKFITLVK